MDGLQYNTSIDIEIIMSVIFCYESISVDMMSVNTNLTATCRSVSEFSLSLVISSRVQDATKYNSNN